MLVTPLLRRLWDDYEDANTRSQARYFDLMGHQRQIRDQSGRKRATKQVRTTKKARTAR